MHFLDFAEIFNVFLKVSNAILHGSLQEEGDVMLFFA
jgi:hypothetical protein